MSLGFRVQGLGGFRVLSLGLSVTMRVTIRVQYRLALQCVGEGAGCLERPVLGNPGKGINQVL